jgi:hypothetical protein
VKRYISVGTVVRAARTDAEGRFRIRGLDGGPHRLWLPNHRDLGTFPGNTFDLKLVVR